MKKKLVKIILLIAMVSLIGSSAVLVNAETEKPTELTSFTMQDGAMFRIVDPMGFRFTASISQEEKDLLEGYYDSVEYGMLIAKGTDNVELLKSNAKDTMVKSEGFDGQRFDGTTNYYNISIYGEFEGDMNKPYIAIGYIKCVKDVTTDMFYADYSEGENVRTPLQIVSEYKAVTDILDTEIASFVNNIIDTAIGESSIGFEEASYSVEVGSEIDVKVLLDGKPVSAVLTFEDDIAEIAEGKIKGLTVGETTLTATVSGASKDYVATVPVSVVKGSKALPLTLKNGVINWTMEQGTSSATVKVDGTDVSSDANGSFDIAKYLKENNYVDGQVYTVSVDNSTANTEVIGSTTFAIDNVDNVEEFLAIDGVENKYFVLTNNIDLLGVSHKSTEKNRYFVESLSSVLDLNGYGVYNVNGETAKDVITFKGLFFDIAKTGVLRNGYVEGSIKANWDYSSLIASTCTGVIENCLLAPTYSVSNGSNYYSTHTLVHQFNGEMHNLVVDYSNANKNTLFDYSGVNDDSKITDIIMIYKQSLQGVLGTWAYSSLINTPMKSFTNVTRYNMMSRLFDPDGKSLVVNGDTLTEVATTENVHENWPSIFEFNGTDKKVYVVNATGKNPCVAPTLTAEVSYAPVKPNDEVAVKIPEFNGNGTVSVEYDVLNKDGESVKDSVVLNGIFKTATTGTYTFVYNAIDEAGRKAVCSAEILVSNVEIKCSQSEFVVANGKTDSKITGLSLEGDYSSETYAYTSSKPSVVTVDDQGNLTYVAKGDAVITVTHEESRATIELNVVSYPNYVAITDVDTFLSIDAKTGLYCELKNDITITDNEKHYTASTYYISNSGERTSFCLVSSFYGVLNGNGYTVTVNRSVADTSVAETNSTSGVFGTIKPDAVVKNTVFKGNVVGAYTSGYSFADWIDGTVVNCDIGIVFGAFNTSSGNYTVAGTIRNVTLEKNIFSGKLLDNSTSNVKTLQAFFRTYGTNVIENNMFVYSAVAVNNNLLGYIDHSNFKIPVNTNNTFYASYDNLIAGTGFLACEGKNGETAKTFTSTAFTETPKYTAWDSVWTFDSTGVKLCGQTVYSK